MLRLPVLVLAVLLVLPTLRAAEEEAKPAEAAKPAAEAAKPERKTVVNTNVLNAVGNWAKAKGVPIAQHGDGPVRMWIVGDGTAPDPKPVLALAAQTLEGLEIWTGRQQIFTRPQLPVEECYHLVLFAKDGDFEAWIDDLRKAGALPKPEGPDLIKITKGFPGPRTMIKCLEPVKPLINHYAVYSTAVMAIDAYYNSFPGDHRTPSWIREGLSADLQRLLCDNEVRCYTIAYENSKIDLRQDWAKTMADMLKKGDPKLIPAGGVVSLETISIPAEHYIQMWSFCTLIRTWAANKKGADNKLARLLEATAAGAESRTAIKQVFNKDEPGLTRAWHAFAQQQK